MACLPAPALPLPDPLPFPITITPPETPDPGFETEWCCKVLAFDIPTPPFPLPPGVVNPGTAGIIKTTLALVQTFIDQQSYPCPRE